MDKLFSSEDYWRAIVLYGLNAATYKIALAKCLYRFAKGNETHVSMSELAAEFFHQYLDRLQNGMPQLDSISRQTKMETIIARFNLGVVTESEAIAYVEANAFADVIPRFHTVFDQPIPVRFYSVEKDGLTLTDDAFTIFKGAQGKSLISEVESRWGLVEAAFLLRKGDNQLVNDIRNFYLAKGYERTNITGIIPVLNGYQNGVCFYCGESMEGIECHVDHVLPRQVVFHDEIWNLVLAHSVCNLQKSDSLPDRIYIDKLKDRNEHFIASNHPIRNELIHLLGTTPQARSRYVEQVYQNVKMIIPWTWSGIRGYHPDTDEFYHSFIRSLR